MTLSDVSRCPECRILSVIARVPAPLSVSPLWVLAQPARAGCHAAQAAPVTSHVTSFVTRATPDIGQHGWAVRAAWSTEAALLISVIVRIPGPGHWSHQAYLTHPGHHHPTPWYPPAPPPASFSSSSFPKTILISLGRKSRWLWDWGPSPVSHPSCIMSVPDYTQWSHDCLLQKCNSCLFWCIKYFPGPRYKSPLAALFSVCPGGDDGSGSEAVSYPVSPLCHHPGPLSRLSSDHPAESTRWVSHSSVSPSLGHLGCWEKKETGKVFTWYIGFFRSATTMRQFKFNLSNLYI